MSNLAIRVMVSIVGIPLLLGVVIYGGALLMLLTVLLSSLALWEFYGMFMKKGFQPQRTAMILFSAAAVILSDLSGRDHLVPLLYVSFAWSALAEMRKSKDREPLNTFIDMLGQVYISIPMVMMNSLSHNEEMNLVVYIFLMIWTCDSFAYFGGRIFGKTPLSEISPKKTIEGSAAGLIMTALVSTLMHVMFPEKISLADAVILGLASAFLAQAGDLFESMIKRFCGVKDSSSVIPGHGGILDRFDSLFFVLPFFYIYFNYLRKYAELIF